MTKDMPTGRTVFMAAVFAIACTLVFAGVPRAAINGDSRFKFVEGSVVLQQSDDDEWFEAQMNYPLGADDKIWSNENSRAEIIAFNGTVLRMDEMTSVVFEEPVRDADGYDILRVSMAEGKL